MSNDTDFATNDELAPPRLADIPRWTHIVYPELSSTAGKAAVWSLPTYKLLRWCSESFEGSETGIYLGELADRLVDCGPRPTPNLNDVRIDEYDWRLYIPYPADLPPPNRHGEDYPRELCTSAGAMLWREAEDISEVNPVEAEGLRQIAETFFPDGELEIEFKMPDGLEGWLVGFNETRFEGDPEESLQPTIGSVLVKHYGKGSVFSTDPEAYPYKVHPRRDPEDPASEPFGCFLVSDKHTLACEIAFDDRD